MIKRYIVFGKNEKKSLTEILMKTHFIGYKKLDSKIENTPNFYYSIEGNKITMDYINDIFSYTGNITNKEILLFKNNYEYKISRKLKIFNIKSKFP